MSIFITGDCHGNFSRFSNKNFDYTNCSKDKDYIIICGDFGGIWTSGQNWKGKNYIDKESREDRYWLDWLSTKPVTFVIIGGNHENYSFIEEHYQIEKFNNALVRKIRKNIIWVERGEIIELNEEKFFCFGGALSFDKEYRIENKTWWSRELPNNEEYKKLHNFINYNNNENIYIITHECPSNIKTILFPNIALIEGFDNFSNALTELYDKNNWRHWFCGHLHQEKSRNKISLMYKNFYKLK